MLRTISLAAIAASAFVAVPASAFAQDAETHSTRVFHADLDLSSADDAAVMLSRLHHAAHSVCTTPGLRPLSERRIERACETQVMEQAVASLDAPVLTALYQDRTPGVGREIQVSSLR